MPRGRGSRSPTANPGLRTRSSAARRTPTLDNALAELHGVDFAYGSFQVLFGVTLEIRRGEILGLLGTNGAGKSTVLRVLSGLAVPRSGVVTFDGHDVTRVAAESRAAAGIALVPGGRALFPDLTVLENLRVGASLITRSEEAARIEEQLALFPRLAERLRSRAEALSGGEQQQLAIAKALLLRPKLLCVDELTLGLSPAAASAALEAVRAAHEAGTTVVVVEQSLNVAAALCERAVFLEKGAVKFEGHPAALLARGDLARSVFLGADAVRDSGSSPAGHHR